MSTLDLEFIQQQQVEHAAWQTVVDALRVAGVGDINAGGKHELLHDVIVAWGEELAALRLMDPNPEHARNALIERRDKLDRWGSLA